MDLPELRLICDYIKIPPVFHSFLEEGPFRKCTVCGTELLRDGVGYVIEKAFRRGEVILECALCLNCRETLHDSLSADSLSRIEAYMEQKVSFVDRRQKLLESSRSDVDPWIGTCLLTHRPITDVDEYQIFAQCDGQDLLFTYLPYMISAAALEEISALLSKQTRDELDGFMGRFFGPPPGLREKLPELLLI